MDTGLRPYDKGVAAEEPLPAARVADPEASDQQKIHVTKRRSRAKVTILKGARRSEPARV
jgi:hypothetical protein